MTVTLDKGRRAEPARHRRGRCRSSRRGLGRRLLDAYLYGNQVVVTSSRSSSRSSSARS